MREQTREAIKQARIALEEELTEMRAKLKALEKQRAKLLITVTTHQAMVRNLKGAKLKSPPPKPKRPEPPKVDIMDEEFLGGLDPNVFEEIISKRPEREKRQSKTREDLANEIYGPARQPKPAPYEPHDFKLKRLTKGMRAMLVTGRNDRKKADMLKDHFNFSSIDILDQHKTKAKIAARRVRSGSYDIVLMADRFASHSAQYILKPACKEAGIPFILVSTGSKTQVAEALACNIELVKACVEST